MRKLVIAVRTMTRKRWSLISLEIIQEAQEAMLKDMTEKNKQKNESQKEAGTLVRKLGRAKQLIKHRSSPKMQVEAVRCQGKT